MGAAENDCTRGIGLHLGIELDRHGWRALDACARDALNDRRRGQRSLVLDPNQDRRRATSQEAAGRSNVGRSESRMDELAEQPRGIIILHNRNEKLHARAILSRSRPGAKDTPTHQ